MAAVHSFSYSPDEHQKLHAWLMKISGQKGEKARQIVEVLERGLGVPESKRTIENIGDMSPVMEALRRIEAKLSKVSVDDSEIGLPPEVAEVIAALDF